MTNSGRRVNLIADHQRSADAAEKADDDVTGATRQSGGLSHSAGIREAYQQQCRHIKDRIAINWRGCQK
jgi:hypothetical protein